MKLIAVINGWAEAPELWRYLLWPPLSIRRVPVVIERLGELAIQEVPAVYSIHVLGFVLYLEINRGMQA